MTVKNRKGWMSGTTRFSADRRACKVFSEATGYCAYIAYIHAAIVTEEDSEYEWDPAWLGPTPNGYQWGYCMRCGQPFHWVASDKLAGMRPSTLNAVAEVHRNNGNWGWVQVSHEEVRAAYAQWLQDVRDEAISDIHAVKELVK